MLRVSLKTRKSLLVIPTTLSISCLLLILEMLKVQKAQRFIVNVFSFLILSMRRCIFSKSPAVYLIQLRSNKIFDTLHRGTSRSSHQSFRNMLYRITNTIHDSCYLRLFVMPRSSEAVLICRIKLSCRNVCNYTLTANKQDSL